MFAYLRASVIHSLAELEVLADSLLPLANIATHKRIFTVHVIHHFKEVFMFLI